MNFGKKDDIDFVKRRLFDHNLPMDYSVMMQYLNEFCRRYPFIGLTSIGESIMGRSIPLVSLGEGKRSLFYVGAHQGSEWITTILLLRYINEYCEIYSGGGRIYDISVEYLFKNRTVYILPMLNPDGVDYQINGIGEDNPLRDRVIRMNRGSEELSLWQANARGVDLDRNYNCRFTERKERELGEGICDGAPVGYSGNMPESEPEVGGLCNFLRFNEDIELVVSLRTQGEMIYYAPSGKRGSRSSGIASRFSRSTGYKVCDKERTGICDWYAEELGKPCAAVMCGKAGVSLDISDNFKLYTTVREMLFSAPTLI